jgi:hypothetical protein
MNDKLGHRLPTERPQGSGGDQAPSGAAILVVLTITAVVCVLGYLFLMKLVGISREEDCALANRRDCAPIEAPSGG